MEENFSFGYWLRRQRLARDLRQAELAAQLGVAPITLRKVEADERRPSLQLIERVAAVFALGEHERATLLQVARADLAPAALPLPKQAADLDALPAPAPEPVALPSGTVTFLFTDIEGSTRHWEQQPDAMRLALARHNQLLQQAIADGGGTLVKHTGDGLLAAFARADDALATALAAQRAFLATDWGALVHLPVRMALHSGAAEPQAGDYLGPALNRAARILAAGHGGQILLSRATVELLRDQIAATVQLRDLGSYRLKDLTHPEQIHQVVVADLPADFPPLRTLDARRHNLPAQVNALIGREREVAQVCELLNDPSVRLATLTGPGGTGKTRLALQAAAELVEQFRDGVWFVNLAPISTAELVLPAIAQTLDIREVGGRSLAETLADALREQQLLLVLDNFEQVLAAAPDVAMLLAGAPQLKLLVTSREALRLSAERVVAVPPLGLPERVAALPPEQLCQYDAVRLFIERARAVRAEFAVTNVNAPALAEICWRLDGLPLAIELAAARVRLFSLEALLARLEQRLPLLTGGARDLPSRQQTLRGAIAWSYALLGESEQVLFRQLGVFVGGWNLAGAAAVGQRGELETLETLTALLDKSLIQQHEGPDGEPRFTMLETIREFALEQLQASGEVDEFQERHTAYLLTFAESVAPELRGPRKGPWCNLVAAEHDNLRAALGRLVALRDAERLARMCIAVWRFWWVRGHWLEGHRWLVQASAALPAIPQTEAARMLRGHTLIGLTWMAIGVSDFAAAHLPAEESLQLLTGTADFQGAGDAWCGKAHVLYGQSDIAGSCAAVMEAYACYQAAGDLANIAFTLETIGFLRGIQGDSDAAQVALEEALTMARAIDDQSVVALALCDLGLLAAARHEYTLAEELIAEALKLSRALDHRHSISGCLVYLGLVAALQGDYRRAEGLQREALELRRSLGDRRGMAAVMSNLASVRLEQGDLAQAREWNAALLEITREIGYLSGMCWYLENSGRIAVASSEHDKAAQLFSAAAAIRDKHAIPIEHDERDNLDRAVAAIRAALGDEAFEKERAAGRLLSVDEALAYAHDHR